MQRPSASGGPTLPPKYACPCLNVKIFPSLANRSGPTSQSFTTPPSGSGWEAVCIDALSVQTAYEQLTSKSRSPENGEHVLCLLCNIIVYRISENGNNVDNSSSSSSGVTSPVGIYASLMSPTTRERIDFHKLFQNNKDNQAWVQVKTRGGCISGRQLEDALSKASPVFGLNIPVIETSPSPTPPSATVPLPSPSRTGDAATNAGATSNLTASISHQLNLNWPEFIPPPPFVPSHPLYAHLARIAKKASSSARTDAEASIQAFIYAKRKEVSEYEAGLKRQVNTVWRVWRDSMEKERPGSSSNTGFSVADPRSNTKRHASKASTSSANSASGVTASSAYKATVIRNFEEDSSVSPRASDSHSIPTSSSFSPSTATPRVQPRMSALGTSLIQSGMHMPRPHHASPSSHSAVIKEPLSPRRTGEKTSPSAARSSSRTPPGNSNSGLQSKHLKDRSEKGEKLISLNDDGAMSPTGASLAITRDFKQDAAKLNGTGKKKAVTFSSKEPDVVTVARDIKSEKLQKMHDEHARGEEAMFDLDIEGEEEYKTSRSDIRQALIDSRSSKAVEQSENTQRVTSFDAGDEQEDNLLSVTVSFKKKPTQYAIARSLPSARHGILASTSPDMLQTHSVQDQTLLSSSPTTAAPYSSELVKLVAGQTPTHRNARAQDTDESEEESDGSEEDDEDEDENDDEDGAMDIQRGDASTSQPEKYRVVSKSIPMDIPAMPSLVEPTKSADNDFENAMSKSHDPGPALELLTLDSRDEEDEGDGAEKPSTASRENASDGGAPGDGTSKEEDLMKRLMEGRGSLHAQKILRRAERDAPTSLWGAKP